MMPGETHAFILKGGTVQFVDYPGSTMTSFEAINDLNQIVGYTTINWTLNGFVYSDGKFTLVNFPGALATYPTGINNKGQIVGIYSDSPDTDHGFLATPGVTIDSLISMLDGFFEAGAIKNADAYAGLRDKLLAAKNSIDSGRKPNRCQSTESLRATTECRQPCARKCVPRDDDCHPDVSEYFRRQVVRITIGLVSATSPVG